MIILKNEIEIEHLRRSNQIVAIILEELRKVMRPGLPTKELDLLAERLIEENGAIPAFKGYRHFPATLCISINEEVVHGIPGERKLKEGDIVSLDLGVKVNGFYGDAAITVPIGKISPEAERLLQVTQAALFKGIEMARKGKRLYDISHAIQSFAERHGFSVVRNFVGHGIGRELHEEPQIPNFGSPNQGPRLVEGMVFALEPMVNLGTYEVEVLSDGWTAVTADRKLSAHFEHTIAITEKGAEILSLLPQILPEREGRCLS